MLDSEISLLGIRCLRRMETRLFFGGERVEQLGLNVGEVVWGVVVGKIAVDREWLLTEGVHRHENREGSLDDIVYIPMD